MNKTIATIVLIAALLGWTGGLHAENTQINISLGGGLHPIQYETKVGSTSPGGGVLFQCQYQYFFKGIIGIGAGVGVDYYNASTEIDETFESEINDPIVGGPYTLRTIFDDWKEKQTLLMAELPVGIYGKVKMGRTVSLILGAGVKVGVPVIKSYQMTDGTIETRAYFGGNMDTEVRDLPHHGLYVDKQQKRGDIVTNTICTSIFADMMFCFKINESTWFHCGFYFSKGVTDIAEHHKSMEGNNYHGILNSDLTDKCVPMSVGAKLGVSVFPSKGSDRGTSGKW